MKFFPYLLLLTAFVTSCSKPNKPVYTGYKNISLQKAGFRISTLRADLGLYNPNTYPLQLKNADVEVWVNKHSLGHIRMDTLIALTPNDTTYLPLRLEAATKELLRNGARLLFNPMADIRLEGNVKAGRGGFFVNVPVNYEGTQRIDLTPEDTASLGLNRAFIQ